MNKFWTATVYNILGIFGLTAFISIFGAGKEAFLFVPVIVSFIVFLLAFVILIPASTRRAAQIMFAASGIVFLIGMGICSAFPFNLH